MRLLFELNTGDFDPNGTAFVRPSVRAVIRQEGRVAMVHSLKYDYYKFPGGGMDPGETQLETLIRETLEEAGLEVLPSSVREYGYVHRIQKGDREDVFIQDNYYYLCQAEPKPRPQSLDEYEAEAGFTLEFVEPRIAIAVNRTHDHGDTDQLMLEREARVLECLMAEGLL